MKPKAQIMDATAVSRAMARITHEIIERNQGAGDICLLGIKRRGIPLAQMLANNIERFEGIRIPVGILDITKHRDDLTLEEKNENGAECHFPSDIRNKTVIVVDDVIYTGRTARAALEAVFSNHKMTAEHKELLKRVHTAQRAVYAKSPIRRFLLRWVLYEI